MKRTKRLVGLLAVALLLAACGTNGGSIVVGSANFPEQLVLGNMYAIALEDAGFAVTKRLNIGQREIYFPALASGEVHVFPEYLGATYAHLSAQKGSSEVITEVGELRAATSALLPESLVLLESSPAQDQDALAVTQEIAQRFNLETVSDLAPVAGQLVAGGPAEEDTRRTGLAGLKDVYGIQFKDFVVVTTGPQTVEALKSRRIQVGRVFTTDAFIEAEGLVVLKEDKLLIPGENVTPIVRKEVLTPQLEQALNAVSKALTTEKLTALNKRVQLDKEDPEAVARNFLVEEGLIER
ncbi:MAG: ABC transporter substrate-binding protein [Egibacteraceae bacterium]